MKISDERAKELYDLLVAHPEGITGVDVMLEKEWSDSQFAAAVQVLRDTFCSEDDTITLVAEPQGFQEPWLYMLVDGGVTPNEDQSRWIGIMLRHIERRTKTMRNVLATAVKATDGRTTLGRKARLFEMHIRHAAEQIALLDENDG